MQPKKGRKHKKQMGLKNVSGEPKALARARGPWRSNVGRGREF
jgi:hypothetical protein